MRLIFILFFSLFSIYSSNSEYLYLNSHKKITIETSDPSLSLTFDAGYERTIKIFLESLDYDYTIIGTKQKSKIKQKGKKTEIQFKKEQTYPYLTINFLITKNITLDVYFKFKKTAWEIIKIIFFVILGIIIAVVVFYFLLGCKEGIKELKIKEEKLLQEKEQKKEDEKCIEIFYDLIKENPYKLNFICPFCFIDRNGKHILGNDESIIIINEYSVEYDTSQEYKEDFFKKIKNGKIKKLKRDFFSENISECKHYYHEDCKNKYKNKYKKGEFKCLFCEEFLTPNNIKAFRLCTSKEYQKAIYPYFGKKKFYDSYRENLINDIVMKFIKDNNDIDSELRNKFYRAYNLANKFKKKGFRDKNYEISVDANLDRLNEEYDELEEERKERALENRRREEEENNRRRNQNTNQEREMSYKAPVKKEEKVNVLSCLDCPGHCVSCGGTCPKAGKYYAHKSCYTDKKCIICRSKKGVNTVVGTCTKCRGKYIKYDNLCIICNQPF